jgi:hypothetical protein
MLISFSSALLEVSKEAPSLKQQLGLEISESANKYPAIEIIDNWDLPLISNKRADLLLTEHQESCGVDCFSEFTIVTYEDSALVDDVKFYTITENDKYEQPIRNYKFEYYTGSVPYEVNDYEYQCSDTGKVSVNGTKEQTCSNVKIGSHIVEEPNWKEYNYNQLNPGTYTLKLEGQKKPSRKVDWIIISQGKELKEWAVWGVETDVINTITTTNRPMIIIMYSFITFRLVL